MAQLWSTARALSIVNPSTPRMPAVLPCSVMLTLKNVQCAVVDGGVDLAASTELIMINQLILVHSSWLKAHGWERGPGPGHEPRAINDRLSNKQSLIHSFGSHQMAFATM